MDDVLALDPDARQRVEVADVMTALDRLSGLSPTETALEASAKLAAAGDQPLAVVDGGEIVGLLRGSDVLRWMMLHRDQAR
jgi:CBS domain-containing protein